MVSLCAAMAGSTARQAREQVGRFASEKAGAMAQPLDAFGTASKQVVDRFYNNLAEGFAKGFSLDEARGELHSGGEGLNNNSSLVDKFNASSGAVATVFARKGDDFVRISTSLKQQDGVRAVGTLLGSTHPAMVAVLAGQTYTARALLFGKHHMTRYQPVRDRGRKVVGLLCIGFGVDKDEAGTRLVQSAGSTMDEIVASVQHVTDVIGAISSAAAAQSQGIDQVNSAVAQCDQMTQQNAARAEESAAAAESLREQAQRLYVVVGTFQLDASKGAAVATALAASPVRAKAAASQPSGEAVTPTQAPPHTAAHNPPDKPPYTPPHTPPHTPPTCPAEAAQALIAQARETSRSAGSSTDDGWASL